MAVEEVFGARTIAVAEVDRDASKVLRSRWGVPNLGDLTDTGWAAPSWQDINADIITAGYPCQPFSHAGRRQGESDERHIWPDILRIVRLVRPRFVVLENVAGHLSLGFDTVLGDLAEAGFDAQWCMLRASDVGAPHQRSRVFVIAADADSSRWQELARGASRPNDRRGSIQRCAAPADCDSEAWRRPRRLDEPSPWGAFEPAVRRWERAVGRAAPAPLNPANHKQLNARFVEWMMGLPNGWVTDLVPNRRALHVLGNGVVPQAAAAALRIMLAEDGLTKPADPWFTQPMQLTDTEFNATADILWDRLAPAASRKAAALAIKAHFAAGGSWTADFYGCQADTHARINLALTAA